MDLSAFLPFRRRPGARKPAAPVRPEVECLEDRRVPSCNTISGHVYRDANANGLFDAGEQVLAGVPMALRNASGQIVARSTTNSQGYYEFSRDITLQHAATTLERTVTFSEAPVKWSRTGAVRKFNPELGTLVEVEIINEAVVTSQIFVENTSSSSGGTFTASVSGVTRLTGPGGVNLSKPFSASLGTYNAGVFDGNVDFGGTSGQMLPPATAADTSSVKLTGSAMNAFIGSGTVTFTNQLDGTGNVSGLPHFLSAFTTTGRATLRVRYKYIPVNCLRPGNYTIVEKVQPPVAPGSPYRYLDGLESRGGVVLPGTVGTDVIPVKLGNKDLRNNNFGEVQASSLHGFVYHDADNDGVKDPGESAIAGALVRLTGTDDQGQAVNRKLTTAADGVYHFWVLRPGTYTLTEVQPAGWADGKDTRGSLGGTVSNDRVASIRVGQNVTGRDYNFGEKLGADVAVTKAASPATVLAGGTVTYTLTVRNLGRAEADGVLVQDSLPAGMTFVSAAASGWTVASSGRLLVFSGVDLAPGESRTIRVTAVAPSAPGGYDNTVVVSSATPDVNPNNNKATARVTVPPTVISGTPPPVSPPPVSPPPAASGPGFQKSMVLGSSGFWRRMLGLG